MKISGLQSRSEGNTLLLVLMLTGVVMISLGSYLALISQQNRSVMRSLDWNAAMPLGETGIEEATSHLTRNRTNYAADGWTQGGTNYTKQRSMGNDYYSVRIAVGPAAGNGTPVTLTSTGFVRGTGSNYISRVVQVTARTTPPVKPIGLIARNIGFGGNLGADSYDSSDPLYSTAGQYDPAKASDQVTVATPGAGFTMKGNSHIKGYVATGPGGTVSAQGSASVGDKNYTGKGIQAGHLSANFTTPLPGVVAPFQSAAAPAAGTVSGTNYGIVLDGGDFMASSLGGSGSLGTMIVTAPSVLYVTGYIYLNKIVFAPGATLDLYMAAPVINFSPAVIGATPAQFSVWGLPSVTSMTINGGTSFTGSIYAPQVGLNVAGNAAIYGAITANSFSCNGTFEFHYDLAIAKAFAARAIRILSWAEL